MELYQKGPKRRDFFNQAPKYAAMNEHGRQRGGAGSWRCGILPRGGVLRPGAGSVQLAVPFFLALFLDSFWMYRGREVYGK